MNKKIFTYALLATLAVSVPAAELYAVQPVKRLTKRQQAKQEQLAEQAKSEQTSNSTKATSNKEQPAQPEITINEESDACEQSPTISESWGKVLRLKWTSLDRQDAKNIGLTCIAGAAAAYGIYNAFTYEFAPSRHIPDYYPQINNQSIYCSICFDSITPFDQKKLSCGHAYCTDCLTGYIDLKLKEKSTAGMQCPDPMCRRKLSPPEIKYVLNNNTTKMDAYYNIRLEEYNIRHNKPSTITDPATAALINKTTKPCPSCKSSIEKNGGCKHMTCSRCKHEFCWECLTNWRYRFITGHDNFYCPKSNLMINSLNRINNLFV